MSTTPLNERRQTQVLDLEVAKKPVTVPQPDLDQNGLIQNNLTQDELDDQERGPQRTNPLVTQSNIALGDGPKTSGLELMRLRQGDDAALFRGIQQSELLVGKPFSRRLQDKITKIAGAPLTRSGLMALYKKCLPNTNVRITDVRAKNNFMRYTVKWLDHDGTTMAQARYVLTRHRDDSLELHGYAGWVDTKMRGQGWSAKAAQQETEMLWALSDHPRTRITLKAGGLRDINNPQDFQNVGAYAWTLFGYDFSQSHDVSLPIYYGARFSGEANDPKAKQMSDLEILQNRFEPWLRNRAAAGDIPNDPELLDGIIEAVALWKHPWDIGTFHVEGLKIQTNIGGHTLDAHLGKAYLTSSESANWSAVFFVNGENAGEQMREAYLERSINKAAERDETQRTQWAQALASSDTELKLKTIADLGQRGGREWLPALIATMDRHPDLKAEVTEAIRGITGERLSELERGPLDKVVGLWRQIIGDEKGVNA